MSDTSNVVEFKAGDLIIKEKSPSDALYIIKEGQLEVFKSSKDGLRIPIAIISSGEYLGEAAILLDRPHSSSVMALTDVKAIKLSRESIDLQLKQSPAWLVALTRGLVARLHHQNEVLRRNGLVDEKLAEKVKTMEEKIQK